MTRLRAAAALCLALAAAPCPAQVVSEPQAFLYVSMPFGAPAAAGLSLRARLDTPARPYVPLVDLRLAGERMPSMRVLGVKVDGAEAEAPINWWIVGGIAVAFVAVVAANNKEEEKKDPQPICQEGFPPPPGGCRPAN